MSLPRHILSLPAALAGLWTAGTASAAPGDLDPAFHGTGWAFAPVSNAGSMNFMAIQSDGKTIAAGNVVVSDDDVDLAVYRFNADGTPDTSFNGTGHVVTTIGPSIEAASAITVQKDGKILLSGYAWIDLSGTLSTVILLVRYLPNGSLDTGFAGGRGILTTTHPDRPGTGGGCLAVQDDGKILVAVHGEGVIRFHPDGSLDGSFGVAGLARMGFDSWTLAVQKDGKILGGGRHEGFTIARLNPDGTPDLSFGSGGSGRSTLFASADHAQLKALIPMDDGRILAAGEDRSVSGDTDIRFVAARVLANGAPDPAFNGTGWNTCLIRPGVNRVSSLLLQKDGRMILAGTSSAIQSSRVDFALARFLPDGSLDTAFGSGGTLNTDFALGSDHCRCAALSPNGYLLAAGIRGTPGPWDFLLARYQISPPRGISVEHPPLDPIDPNFAAPQDFGLVTLGSRSREYVIRNTGTVPLTGISVSVTAESHPGEFVFSQPASNTLVPGAHTTFVVDFTPSAVPGPRTGTLTVSSSAAPPPFTIPLTGTRATPLQTWRITWFGSPDNSGPGADLNDFDRDGLVNLLEYATASHPHQSSLSPGALVKTPDLLEFTYTRPLSALTELTWQPEISHSPAGPWSAAGITSTVLSDNGLTQTVRVSAPAAGDRQFFQLKVTRP